MLEKYVELTKDVENAILKCENKNTAKKLIDFFRDKKQKYSFDRNEGVWYVNSFIPTVGGLAWNRLVNGVARIADKGERVPLISDIVVTGKCHCNCWHCFREKHNSSDLTFEKISQCIDGLHELGVASIGITGGEPMLREDIFDIMKLIPADIEGLLYSTGKKIDDEVAKKLKQTAITRCIISLDHYDQDIVSRLRGNENAFVDAVRAIESLTKAGMYTTATVCITEQLREIENLEKYLRFVNDLGVSEIRIVMQIPQGKLENKNVGKIYAETLNMVDYVKDKYNGIPEFATILNFSEIESSSYFGCSAGANYFSINNDGAITPCVAVPLSFGNVYEKDIKDIYNEMAEYFPCSSRVCYGIASGRIIKSENIDTSKSPLSEQESRYIGKKCVMATGVGELFKYCRVE